MRKLRVNALRRLLDRFIVSRRREQIEPHIHGSNLEAELLPLVDALSIRFHPDRRFVGVVARRLREADVVAGRTRIRSISYRPARPLLVLCSILILAASAGVASWAVLSRYEAHPVHAEVLASAYDGLLSQQSVRYSVQGEVSHGMCSLGFNVPLTKEELEGLELDKRPADGTGTVVRCLPGKQSFEEQGVYDLAHREFYAKMKPISIGEGGFGRDVETLLMKLLERRYVQGRLYVREGDGPWQVQNTSVRWTPFDVEGVGGIPSGGLGALKKRYDQVEELRDTTLDGVSVKHYRAVREDASSGILETVEVWVGKEDGLPRRALIQVEEPYSPMEMMFRHIDFDDPESEYYQFRDDPVVIRGELPSRRVVRWTYTFSDFNTTVHIEPPRLEIQGE